MNPGRMRNRIEFYTPSKVADGYGGFTSSGVASDGQIWGHAVEQSGEMKTQDGKRNYYREIEVTVRRKDFNTGIGKKFKVDGAGYYRVNNFYHILNNDEYTKIIGTLEP